LLAVIQFYVIVFALNYDVLVGGIKFGVELGIVVVNRILRIFQTNSNSEKKAQLKDVNYRLELHGTVRKLPYKV